MEPRVWWASWSTPTELLLGVPLTPNAVNATAVVPTVMLPLFVHIHTVSWCTLPSATATAAFTKSEAVFMSTARVKMKGELPSPSCDKM